MKNTRATIGDLDGLMHLVCRFFSRKVLSSLCSTRDKEYILEDLGSKPGRSPIVWS